MCNYCAPGGIDQSNTCPGYHKALPPVWQYFSPPTMEELNYTPGVDEWMEVTKDGTNFGFGAQFLFPINQTHIGFDIGYTHIFDNKAIHDQLDGRRGYIEQFRDKEYSLYLSLLTQPTLKSRSNPLNRLFHNG